VTRRKNGGGGGRVMAYLAETAEVYDCDDTTVSFRAAATVPRARKLQQRTPV